MKPIIFSSLLVLVLPIAQSQSAFPWGPVDTITTGDTDDRNPALAHGTMSYGWSNGQWMAFERRTPTESMITVKRLAPGGVWDTSTTILSHRPLTDDQRLPDISAGYYDTADSIGTRSHDIALVVWQRHAAAGAVVEGAFMRETTWGSPFLITQSSSGVGSPKVRFWSDSLFLVAWVEGNALAESFVSPGGMTSPDTIGLSSLGTMEYDIATRYDLAIAVWTTRDSSGQAVMMQSGRNRYPEQGWQQSIALPFSKGARNPHLLFPSGYSLVPILFEAGTENQRDIFLLQEDYMDTSLVNISNDPTADDINARGYMTPFVVKSSSSSMYTYFDAFAMEKIRGTDSMLVFDKGYEAFDTVRTPGTNRKISIGSKLIGAADNGVSVYAVWESDRTGVSHIYGRQRFIPWLAVEERQPVPRAFVLHQNFPNPFNPATTLLYDMPVSAQIKLAIFDILGRQVVVLADGYQSAGSHTVRWDASGCSTGMYIARLIVGENEVLTGAVKLMLIK